MTGHTCEIGGLDEAGIERAVAEVEATQDRCGTVLMQVPREPLTDPFGPGEVDVPYLVRRIVTSYFGSSEAQT